MNSQNPQNKKYGYNKLQIKLNQIEDQNKDLINKLEIQQNVINEKQNLIENLEESIKNLSNSIQMKEELLDQQFKKIVDLQEKLDITISSKKIIESTFSLYKEQIENENTFQKLDNTLFKLSELEDTYQILKKKYQDKGESLDKLQKLHDKEHQDSLFKSKEIEMLNQIVESKNKEIKLVASEISKCKEELLVSRNRNYLLELELDEKKISLPKVSLNVANSINSKRDKVLKKQLRSI